MEGALHFENASLTLCFWSLEPEKLERRIKDNAEVDATGRYILSRWCAEAYTPLAHRYGSIIYQRRGCQFCSVHSTGFLRTSTADRQKPDTPLFFCSDGIILITVRFWVFGGHERKVHDQSDVFVGCNSCFRNSFCGSQSCY